MQVSIKHENFKNDYIPQLLWSRHITDLDAFLHPTEDNIQSFNFASKNIVYNTY